MKVAGVIVAGGRGSRMGAEKPLMPFRGGVLLDAVIAAVSPQVDGLALNVPAESIVPYQTRYGARHPLLTDPLEGPPGPLAGVIAGLRWLLREQAGDWLASFPGDTPFLPPDLVARLAKAAGADPAQPVTAGDETQIHYLCTLWPGSVLAPLEAAVADGTLRSVWRALGILGGRVVHLPASPHAFFNVNSPDDLARAEAIAAGL